MIGSADLTRRWATIPQELRKLPAFLRRDFLVAWSYRFGFILEIVSLIAQAVSFYFVSLMVNPERLPRFGGVPATYMAFVSIGIALSTLLNVGMGRMIAAIRSEQLMGTFESLLITPTSPMTLQLGLVLYDLIYLPIRTGVFLSLVAVLFRVEFHLQGILPAAAIVAAFLPFVWGLGAASAAATMAFRQVAGLVGLGGYALGVASGAYFPIELLPPWLASISRVNPVAIALHGTREALLGGAGWDQALSRILILIPISFLSLWMGMAAFRLAEERERRAGTLGLY